MVINLAFPTQIVDSYIMVTAFPLLNIHCFVLCPFYFKVLVKFFIVLCIVYIEAKIIIYIEKFNMVRSSGGSEGH